MGLFIAQWQALILAYAAAAASCATMSASSSSRRLLDSSWHVLNNTDLPAHNFGNESHTLAANITDSQAIAECEAVCNSSPVGVCAGFVFVSTRLQGGGGPRCALLKNRRATAFDRTDGLRCCHAGGSTATAWAAAAAAAGTAATLYSCCAQADAWLSSVRHDVLPAHQQLHQCEYLRPDLQPHVRQATEWRRCADHARRQLSWLSKSPQWLVRRSLAHHHPIQHTPSARWHAYTPS